MTELSDGARVGREELDALLGAPSRPAPAVAHRDFGQPRRLSGERRERVARTVRASLSEIEAQFTHLLRRPVRIELGAIGELSIEGYFVTLPDPFAVLAFRAGGQPAWIVWEPLAAVGAVELVLGAAGDQPEERALSSLERGVLERVLRIPAERLCAALGLSGGPFSVPAKREQLGSWRDAGERADPHRISLELLVESAGATSRLRVYLPTTHFLADDEKPTAPPKGPLPRHLGDVVVDITVRLGGTEVPLAELLALEVGDVVPLDTPASAPVMLCADERRFALGRLGSRRGRLAVRVSELAPGGPTD